MSGDQVISVDWLAQRLRSLREGPGLTAAKATAETELLRAFGLESPTGLIDLLERAYKTAQSKEARAALNALAIGNEPLRNLTERRRRFLSSTHAVDLRTVMRWEDAGFIELAHVIHPWQVDDASSSGMAGRIATLERELSATRVVLYQSTETYGLALRSIQAIFDVLVDENSWSSVQRKDAMHGMLRELRNTEAELQLQKAKLMMFEDDETP